MKATIITIIIAPEYVVLGNKGLHFVLPHHFSAVMPSVSTMGLAFEKYAYPERIHLQSELELFERSRQHRRLKGPGLFQLAWIMVESRHPVHLLLLPVPVP